MQKNAARRRKRGFTLQEMLLAILLFAILAGLAIPGVIALQRSLHMKKLDEYARQIYIAAQNELTEMKASGRLELFAKELTQQDDRLTTRPSDYPTSDDDSWKDLFYVSSDSTEGQNYLLRADDSLRQATEQGGGFIVELNPISGDVYSAFYAEESFNYNQVCSITAENRDKSTRQKATPQLGYYSSSTDEYGTVGMPSKFEPKIDVVNGEELALNVSCDHLMALRRTQRYLTLTVTITDEDQNSEELTFHGGTDFFVVNDSITVTKILDSLEEQNRFANVLPDLTAGDDLTITAKMTYADKNNNINIMGETTVENVSSLFAAKTTGESGTTINVDHVRHLNNLRSSIYNTDKVAQVVQTGNISFLFDNWKSGTDYVSAWTKNPMERFPAIENDKLFNGGRYDGQLNTITGFNFTAEGTETYAALFGGLNKTTLNGVRLVDCAATGGYAATLAGQLTDCTVTDCGAYLTTKSDMGASYDMAARRVQYRVNGQNTAGGLIAVAQNTVISTSFGAVDVNGGANNGGLVGLMTGGSVSQSYGSGNITAATGANNGGLVGQMSGSDVSSCYATGKVQAPQSSGGLIGSSSGGAVSNCNSYGRVTTDGENETGTNCGGFVGAHSNTAFSECAFLQQASYNSNYSTVSGVNASAYTTMRKGVTEAEQIGLSTPYLAGLQGHGFPFPLCKNGENQMMHYGDWPEAYQLQTSLVYYEKYADGQYGYYARTCLISGGESAGDNWVVDTLRDEYCVEDGYALMTSYVLESFNYTLDTQSLDAGERYSSGSVQIVKNEADVKKENSLLLLENAELKFENKDNASGQETTISNAKVYRLPFALQITNRITASHFWEELRITGISSVTHEAVFTDQTFYYCPDFAKNAYNPAAGDTNMPDDPGGEGGTPVYVRSPRQLNGLSRSTYYWNTKNGGAEKVQFIQETDLRYNEYTKNYCGDPQYDLMNTDASNPYRNKPIGFPNSKSNGKTIVNNFRNSYDGQGHKIVDYCVANTEYRFAGLFGEVEKCIIKNVVMEASTPYQSAYVRSTKKGDWNESPGVGALVGLVYMPRSGDVGNDPTAVVENCSVSGYIVEYNGNASTTNAYAVGGLIGFNFGEVRNCSAVCDVRLKDETGKEGFAGGLVGSLNGKGSIDNSYAGGTFYVRKYAKVGGLCGGYVDTYGYGMQEYYKTANKNPDVAGTLKMRISECYSYSTIRHGSDAIADSTGHLFGVCVPVWNNNDASNYISIDSCYYLLDTVQENALYTKVTDGSTGLSYSQLVALNLPEVNGAAASGTASAENSHPFPASTDLIGKAYPFPAVVQAMDGAYVHYGDWPVSNTADNGTLDLTQSVYLVYYEQYADGSYGVYSRGNDGKTIDNLNNEKVIAKTGYGFLTQGMDFMYSPNNWTLNSSAEACGSVLVDQYQSGYSLIDMKPDCLNYLCTAGWEKTRTVRLLEARGGEIQTLYANGLFARGIYSEEKPNEFLIRTENQLKAATTLGADFTFTLDHDIVADAELGMLNNNASGSTYKGNGYVISGLAKPLFDQNAGVLDQLVLTDVKIDYTGNAAALALTNVGTIQNCSVTGTVQASGNAAGLVLAHSNGKIVACSVNGTVGANGNAAGLVLDGAGYVDRCAVNANVNGTNAGGVFYERSGGTVSNTYYSGMVSAVQTAAGFWTNNSYATATNCFVKAKLQGENTYGFALKNYNNSVVGFYVADSANQESLGTACTFIDWSNAMTNGIPNENWPNEVQYQLTTATASEEDTTPADTASQSADTSAVQSADDAA